MEKINGHIYLLIDKRNGKKYIGKHNGNKTRYFSSGLIPNRIIKKYGKDVFEKIILENNIESIKSLNEKEKFFIEKYNTFNDGYNLTLGGDGGNEWVLKKTKKELDVIADIKRKKNLGRKFTEDTIKKMSDAKKGKPLSNIHKLNIKKSQSGEKHPFFGKKHKDETKLKMSKSKSGKNNPQHSEYMRKNNPRSKKISINNQQYNSIQEASEKLNLPRHIIKNRLKSKKYSNWFKI